MSALVVLSVLLVLLLLGTISQQELCGARDGV